MKEIQKTCVHIGKNVRRLREIRDIKQESLATALSVSQQKVSKLERSEIIDEDTLRRIAGALQVSVDIINNFDEGILINNTNAVVSTSDFDHNTTVSNQGFKPIEKIIELYERLIESERDKNIILASVASLKERETEL